MIVDLIAQAKAQGLSEKRACAVLELSPRTLQRWRQPVAPVLERKPRARPHNALTRAEAAAVVSVIRSTPHADQSCRELALSLVSKTQPIAVSHVTIWRYQTELGCHGPRGRQLSARARAKPDTEWVNAPLKLWDWDGRPYGRLMNASRDATHHQGWVSSPWRFRTPSRSGLVSFQGT